MSLHYHDAWTCRGWRYNASRPVQCMLTLLRTEVRGLTSASVSNSYQKCAQKKCFTVSAAEYISIYSLKLCLLREDGRPHHLPPNVANPRLLIRRCVGAQVEHTSWCVDPERIVLPSILICRFHG